MPSSFESRAAAFLDYVIDHSDNSTPTVWGPYSSFDGYALAHFARRRNLDQGFRHFAATLNMMDANFAKESASPNDKWHLADFALHPMLRCWFLYRNSNLEQSPQHHALWPRFQSRVANFLWHYGDLTENHNLLHLAGRYLAAQLWPDTTYLDGSSALARRDEARTQIYAWMNAWLTQGSTEWGADIYYNVNLLALFNLHDFANEPPMREAARTLIDFLLLDEMLDTFAGSMVSAARRGYGVYRVDTRCSPSRPLLHLYLNSGNPQPFNLNFIGGVLQAATSSYRPHPALLAIGNNHTDTFLSSTTHTVGIWSNHHPFPIPNNQSAPTDHLAKHSWRSPHALLSVMQSPGSLGRYTEQVWQATLSEDALVFSNHPVPGSWWDKSLTWPIVENRYLANERGTLHPHWVVGNQPPGTHEEFRPGFWQGNHYGPRSYGEDNLAFLLYDIQPDAFVDWIHLFFPRHAFDTVIEKNHWIAAQKNQAYVAVWLPQGHTWITQGTWANIEVRSPGTRTALLAITSDTSLHPTFDSFLHSLAALNPAFDPHSLTLSATSPRDAARISVSYTHGPSRNNQLISTKGPRFQTPWGSLPLGHRSLTLHINNLTHTLHLNTPDPS